MRIPIRNIVVLVGVSLLLCACQPSPSATSTPGSHKTDDEAQPAPKMSLQLYNINPDSERRIAGALGPVLGGHSRVSSPTPGQILVLAPEAVQPTIKTLLTKLNAARSNSNTPGNIRIHFWLIDGSQSAATSNDPRLKQLKPALDELRKSLPQLHFAVRDDARMQLVPGERAQLHTNQRRLYQVTSEQEGTSSMRLKIAFSGARNDSLTSFNTSLSARPGQYVVLASVPETEGGRDNQSPDGVGLRAVVMRADWNSD